MGSDDESFFWNMSRRNTSWHDENPAAGSLVKSLAPHYSGFHWGMKWSRQNLGTRTIRGRGGMDCSSNVNGSVHTLGVPPRSWQNAPTSSYHAVMMSADIPRESIPVSMIYYSVHKEGSD